MKHLLLISSFATSVLLAHSVSAQEGPERRRRHYNAQARAYYRGPVRFTAGGGVALYSGDLGGLSQNFPGGSVSLGLLYLLRPHLVIGAEGSYFQTGAKDKLPERGLAFKGQNISGVTFLRYELLRDESQFASPKRGAALVKPYIKAGAGLLLYNPNAYIGTNRADQNTAFLRPERNDYPALAVVAPVGLGVVLRLSQKLNATVEGAYYFTTSDHLDDISQRANPKQNDGYGLVELKLEYAPWNR